MPSETHIALIGLLVLRWIISGLLVVIAITQPYTLAFSITVLIAAAFIVPSSNKAEPQDKDFWRFAVAFL